MNRTVLRFAGAAFIAVIALWAGGRTALFDPRGRTSAQRQLEYSGR